MVRHGIPLIRSLSLHQLQLLPLAHPHAEQIDVDPESELGTARLRARLHHPWRPRVVDGVVNPPE